MLMACCCGLSCIFATITALRITAYPISFRSFVPSTPKSCVSAGRAAGWTGRGFNSPSSATAWVVSFVTNAIRTLSDVFCRAGRCLEFLRSRLATRTAARTAPKFDRQNLRAQALVLASPDIPAETLLSTRGNFLASALSRFDEAYLFSNEGDEVLRQDIDAGELLRVPRQEQEPRLPARNVEILSRKFGMIDVNEQDYLRVLRIGNLTLQELYDTLEDAREKRLVASAAAPERAPLPRGSPISTVPIISTAIIRTSPTPETTGWRC